MHDTSENYVFWGYTNWSKCLTFTYWTKCAYYIKRMRLYTSFVLTQNLWRVSNTNRVNHVIRKIYFLFEGVFCLSALYKITRKTMNSQIKPVKWSLSILQNKQEVTSSQTWRLLLQNLPRLSHPYEKELRQKRRRCSRYGQSLTFSRSRSCWRTTGVS